MANWIWARPYFLAVTRSIASLVLAYCFVLVLMTASLQTRVAERLEKNSIDYSSGFAMWTQSVALDARLEELRKERIARRQALALKTAAEEDSNDAYLLFEAPLQSLVGRLKARGCEINLGRRNPEDVANGLAQLRACTTQQQLPAPVRAEAEEVLKSSGALIDADRKWLRDWREKQRVEQGIKALQDETATTEKRQAELEAGRKAFEALGVLRNKKWLAGGNELAHLAPEMTQILLAFVSGMFGALLITLVLIVYPSAELRTLNLTSAESNYGPRILLGGLISVCVFVVLGGGTAVLGTASAFTEGKANFMAFCAIGILAGMFSDQVAFWLSERAAAFFRRQREEGGHEEQENGTALTVT